ncbi:MAG: undecaprenyl phosphate translocase family protein, partial [Bacteroidia bacterium]
PGISGSYILVMLGKYAHIIGMISTLTGGDFSVLPSLIVFALGCISGLLFFARILQWLLKHYHDVVVAALCGFMIGSLNKVWPWKNTLEWYTDSHGVAKPLIQENIAPPAINNHFFIALALALGGLLFVLLLDKAGAKMKQAG